MGWSIKHRRLRLRNSYGYDAIYTDGASTVFDLQCMTRQSEKNGSCET